MIETFKSAYDHARDVHHFNNAGFAPWSLPTRDAVAHWSSKIASGGAYVVGDAFAESEKTRSKLARFIGTSADQIAFSTTCATAISQVALGFPFKPNDEIVVWDQEYPSNFHPWRVAAERTGAKLVVAKSETSLATPIENLKAVVTPKTRVIAVSWIQFRTGAQTDLKELAAFAKSRGIFTCVDVIQGLGAIPFHFDSLGIDAVCGGAHKWLSSPHSLGFLALKKEHLELLSPIAIGAMCFGGPDVLSSTETQMVKGTQKFEPGGRPLLELIGMGAALDLFSSVGIESISAEAERIASKIAVGIRDHGYDVHSPHGEMIKGAILNFSPTSSSPLKSFEEIEAKLTSLKFTFSKRPPGVRISPHAFLRDDEVQILLDGLAGK